jgi:hypothetical protein
VRVASGRRLAGLSEQRRGARREPLADGARHLPVRLRARIGHFDDRLAFGIERHVLVPVVEGEPVHVVDEGLGRHVVGQDQRVVVHLDVIERVGGRHIGLAHDRRAVHQCAGLYQHRIDQDRMIGRDQEVARWDVLRERAGLDADRQNAHRIGEDPRHGLAAEPAHRHVTSVGGGDEIALPERLDADFAGRGQHLGARHEADRRFDIEIVVDGAGVAGDVGDRRVNGVLVPARTVDRQIAIEIHGPGAACHGGGFSGDDRVGRFIPELDRDGLTVSAGRRARHAVARLRLALAQGVVTGHLVDRDHRRRRIDRKGPNRRQAGPAACGVDLAGVDAGLERHGVGRGIERRSPAGNGETPVEGSVALVHQHSDEERRDTEFAAGEPDGKAVCAAAGGNGVAARERKRRVVGDQIGAAASGIGRDPGECGGNCHFRLPCFKAPLASTRSQMHEACDSRRAGVLAEFRWNVRVTRGPGPMTNEWQKPFDQIYRTADIE